jgi:hypothetical protein
MFVSCVLSVFEGIGICDDMITRSDESDRLYVVVSDLGTSTWRPHKKKP